MKILISLDLGKLRPISDGNIVLFGAITDTYSEVTVDNLLGLDKPSLPHGTIIEFDGAYLTKSQHGTNLYEAEYHGILET